MKKKYFNLLVFLTTFSVIFSQQVTTIINAGTGINDAMILLENGDIIGSDHAGENVYLLSSEGVLTILAGELNAPNGLEMDSEGNIYVGLPKEDKILKLSSSGSLSEYIPQIINPNNIMFKKGSDTLIVASYLHNRLYNVAPEGTIELIFEGSPLNGPLGMAYDDENNLYVANFTDGKIFRFNGGTPELFTVVPGATVSGLEAAVGFLKFINGRFYASGFGKNKIYTISKSGVVEEFAGSGIAGTRDGDASQARFYWPNGITSNITGDTLYISEYYTHAVRMITNFTTFFEQEESALPETTDLLCNYPNPFNPETTITFKLAEQSDVTLKIYNAAGELVEVLAHELMPAGTHKKVFRAYDVASGLYLYNLQVNNKKSFTGKMLLIK